MVSILKDLGSLFFLLENKIQGFYEFCFIKCYKSL